MFYTWHWLILPQASPVEKKAIRTLILEPRSNRALALMKPNQLIYVHAPASTKKLHLTLDCNTLGFNRA